MGTNGVTVKPIQGIIERWLHYRGRLQCISAMLVLFEASEAGWFREVAALYSDHMHLRQVPLYKQWMEEID